MIESLEYENPDAPVVDELDIGIELYYAFAEEICGKMDFTDGKIPEIEFVTDPEMRELNRTFRGKDSPTDVLSFTFDEEDFEDQETLGDLAISIDTARRQAIENGLPLDLEIKQLILHGILHLCGYDHETDSGEMNSLEIELRTRFDIS
ncbi:MAG: rRNA maturation RNase YbeY [Pyrinomonadaceae bacterium]